MALSWNEIKDRAIKFSKEWADTQQEDAEAKPFIEDFFDVFGITRKRVGTFEHKVKKLNETDGYIDLLWKGTILIEMKSRGKNLDKAFEQAKEYTAGLKEYELPKYILVCDFYRFRLFDTEEDKTLEFTIDEFVKNVHHFGFIAGYQKRIYKEQDPVNIKAAELMGKLHDRLKAVGYDGHPLEVYLVRLLFCLFAEDTTIFESDTFKFYIEQRTHEDGSDLAARISELFYVLNTPPEKRLKNIDEQLNAFPYVNGKLFEETLPPAAFDSAMRNTLLECCTLNWGKISPAIFGSMFQSVMNATERRNLGAHYTSEKNILKLIKPLFLDELWKEFESIKNNKNKLHEFHKRISTLKFLDPACGCGNFLVITYRELRLLELEILRALYKNQTVTNIESIVWLDVDMMYGIEYEEFPCRIAEVAMWLIDHQMNMAIGNEFSQYFARLPLKKAANITNGNALALDWNKLAKNDAIDITADVANIIVNEPIEHYNTLNVYTKQVNIIDGKSPIAYTGNAKFDYILGNPPFIGKSMQNAAQKADMEKVFTGVKGAGVLDYVSAWYIKAAQLIQNTKTKVAFVSTNSITQGEQVGMLWNLLFNYYKIKIHFAHRTFKWGNEAKGNAAVHVVIIGFANNDINEKHLFEYEDIKGEAHETKVKNINPYLVEGKDLVILKRKTPISAVPEISFGNMPNDGGHFLFTDIEKINFIKNEPKAEKFFKPLISANEFLNGENRWCLWLKDAEPNEIKELKEVTKRIEAVKKSREASSRETTKNLAKFPALFGEIRQPLSKYILIPRVSSENRAYIPIDFFDKNSIVSDSCLSISNATLFHFGILTSKMHMTWVKNVCGRLKSDYRYSNEIVYNNYPWPENPNNKQIKTIETAALNVLEARAEFPNSSLADLYNPLTMPPSLVKAHNDLDKAVDLAYRPQPFTNDANRMVFLFELYEKYTADLFTKEKVKKNGRNIGIKE